MRENPLEQALFGEQRKDGLNVHWRLIKYNRVRDLKQGKLLKLETKPGSGSQDLKSRKWQPGSGSQGLVAKIWKPGCGSQDLAARS